MPHKEEEEEEEEDEEAPPPAERDMGYCFGCHKPSATAVRCAGCSGVFWCSENGSTCATVRGWTHDCLCKTWRRYCAENGHFFGVFSMVVPSLSWQKDDFIYINGSKSEPVFLPGSMPARHSSSLIAGSSLPV